MTKEIVAKEIKKTLKEHLKHLKKINDFGTAKDKKSIKNEEVRIFWYFACDESNLSEMRLWSQDELHEMLKM